jgi:hypothetical protein
VSRTHLPKIILTGVLVTAKQFFSGVFDTGPKIFSGVKLDENFEAILSTVKKTIAYWEPFKLTLPGRINVTKSLLLSLVNYLGCFLMPSPRVLNVLQTSMDCFSTGKLRVAKDRLYTKPEEGGLGLFKLDEFLSAQQSTWVIRAHKSARDNWRVNLSALSYGYCLCASTASIKKNTNPILYGLATSYGKLRRAFDTLNENYLNATLFNNPIIFRGRGDHLMLDPQYLAISDNFLLTKKLARLTVEECHGEHGFLSHNDLQLFLGLEVPVFTYDKIRTAVMHFISRIRPNENNDGSAANLFYELRIKKPGKKIRTIMLKKRKGRKTLENLTQSQTFFRLIDLEYCGSALFSKNISLWSCSGYTNRHKLFFFKFYNNILGINTRTSHFGVNQTRNCTFCSMATPPRNIDETFSHLFFECDTTKNWHRQFIATGYPEMNLTPEREKKLWFLGIYDDNIEDFVISSFLTFQYVIWEAKLKKRQPSFHTLFTEFLDQFRLTVHHNSDVKTSGTHLNYSLCRRFLGPRAGDG